MPFDNDLTTYVEVDGEGLLEVVFDRITADNLQRDQDAYVYKDRGVDFYDGDFDFDFYTFIDSSSDNLGTLYPFFVANQIDNASQLFLNDRTLSLTAQENSGSAKFQLRELAFGSVIREDFALLSLDTKYWHEIERIGGTLTDKIYSDKAHTVLVDTLSIAPTSVIKFRYEYPANSINNSGQTQSFYGYMGIDVDGGVVVFRRRMEEY